MFKFIVICPQILNIKIFLLPIDIAFDHLDHLVIYFVVYSVHCALSILLLVANIMSFLSCSDLSRAMCLDG